MRFQSLFNALFLAASLCAALAAASAHGDTMYVVSSSNGSIGTYSSLNGAAINPSLVTGLTTPEAIAFDPDLNFYVTGFTAEYVAKYATNGTLINADYLSPSGFEQPTGITVNGVGEIFVVNNAVFGGSTSVSKFAPDGTLIDPRLISFEGQNRAYGLTIDSEDNIFVGSFAGNTIGKYRPDGSTVNAEFITGLPGNTFITIQPVPEPSTVAREAVAGLGGLAALRRCKHQA